jgi:hypothetical protein
MSGNENENTENHYAVVIGINLYTSSSLLPDLHGPTRDAEDFVHWLETSGGLKSSNIRKVPASARREVPAAVRSPDDDPLSSHLNPTLLSIHRTLLNVNEEMSAILGDNTKVIPGSRLYIFVAGHGMSKVGETATLFSTEAGKGMWGYSFSLKSCLDWYREYGPFAEVVMFADVCRTRYEDVGVMGLPFDKQIRGGEKRLIIYYATSDGDQAYEDTEADVPDPDDRRGYFSRALIESLASAVDHDKGHVTSVSLADSVKLRVHQLSAGVVHPPQECLIEGTISPPLFFGPRRIAYPVQEPSEVYPVRMRVVSQLCGVELQLLNGSLTLIDRFYPKSVGDIWEKFLPGGLYDLQWKVTSTAEYEIKTIRVEGGPVTVDV